MKEPASKNELQRKTPSTPVSTRPPPERCILSQATAQPLPVTPLYAEALRNSLNRLSLRAPEVEDPRPILGLTKKISKAKVRESHKEIERRYRPSPLGREALEKDVEVQCFLKPSSRPVGIPALNPKILKKLYKLKILHRKEEGSAPILPREYTPPLFPRACRATQIQLQPQLYPCHFARLQRVVIPERGRLLKRSLALNQNQEAHVLRRSLLQTLGIAVEEPGQESDAIDAAQCKRCKRCLKRERKRTKKAAKLDLKMMLKAIRDSKRGEEKEFEHLDRESIAKQGLDLHLCSRMLDMFSKRVLVLRGAELFN
ncbi:hypothetical protein PMIN03_008607 [Paraphaeosphaeria minitans]|uniref:Uncharacterized protein n=1 Tax=Paraphaeosphaeria minitans TaxID=565426 RepID=A0A9P6GTM4_9PLEO|nr:hypothetical protein PMIN01_00720 [Paraphaeosphaeria minitans]